MVSYNLRPMLEVTAIRAATVLLRTATTTLLTDPWFGERMWWVLPTWQKPGVTLDALPPIDLVLATHLHPDHYDGPAVKALWKKAPRPAKFIAPPGSRSHVTPSARADLLELGPDESFQHGRLRVTATHCRHTGPSPDEVNFVLEQDGETVFFGGDARFSPVFLDVGRRFRIDVAFLPVSGTEIFGTRTTMDEEEAYVAACDLGAKIVVPIHEGGLWMSVPPASRHPGRARRLQQLAESRGAPFQVVCVEPGRTVRLLGGKPQQSRDVAASGRP